MARPGYDTRNADGVLRDAGIECPPFESYLLQLVEAVQGFLEARQRLRGAAASTREVHDPLA